MDLLIDTNVLVYISNPADSHHRQSLDAVDVAIHRNYRPCIVPQVFYEFWVVATRPVDVNGLGLSVGEAQDCLAVSDSGFTYFETNAAYLSIGGTWSPTKQSSARRPTTRASSPPCSATA
jgi:hypothetical protein